MDVSRILITPSSQTNPDIFFKSRPTKQRIKDRPWYKYKRFTINITSIETLQGSNQNSSRAHEVEVEIDQTANLYDELMKYENVDASSQLFQVVTEMVKTVCLLLE